MHTKPPPGVDATVRARKGANDAALENKPGWAGDLWGGMAAMLVAVPSAIAFGVTILAPLGASFAPQGALAGILGATLLGILAALLGGTPRLISAPCAPAAAVLSAFAVGALDAGRPPESIVAMLLLAGLLCGVLQVTFGMVGLGRLIKYMPYPVVSGYLTAVGLIIIGSQVPRFVGAPGGRSLWDTLEAPLQWSAASVAIGASTALAMLVAPRMRVGVPAPIAGLAAGALAYFALGAAGLVPLALADNPLLVGTLAKGGGEGLLEAALAGWSATASLAFDAWEMIFVPGITLAVLLSIDTLKTCVVTDALTRSRHQSNRELIGQGCGNLASALAGGVPGAGTLGATLVNLAGGAQSRWSGVIEGALALLALLVLAPLIAWVPISALAAILIVIGVRMLDVDSLRLARSRATALDFVVVAAVVVVAQAAGLVAASGVGVGLAVLLFVREQIGGAVVRRKLYGNQTHSKRMRLPQEMAILERHGERAVVLELQGSLFFGTADQLYAALEPELKVRDYVTLDLRRVQSVDVTAAHLLQRVGEGLAERDACLIFTQVPKQVPTGQDMARYFEEVGRARPEQRALVFDALDEALEWVENRIIEAERLERPEEKPLELDEMELFKGRKAETLAALAACMETRTLGRGERLFARGDTGDELFLVRSGLVRILLPLEGGKARHLASFGRGDFFGEMAFLDRDPRSADAVAAADTSLYVLSRKRFDALSEAHRKLALNLLEGLARSLAIRLRYTNAELRALDA